MDNKMTFEDFVKIFGAYKAYIGKVSGMVMPGLSGTPGQPSVNVPTPPTGPGQPSVNVPTPPTGPGQVQTPPIPAPATTMTPEVAQYGDILARLNALEQVKQPTTPTPPATVDDIISKILE